MKIKIFSVLVTTLIFSLLFQNCSSNEGVSSGFSTMVTSEQGQVSNPPSSQTAPDVAEGSSQGRNFPGQLPTSSRGAEQSSGLQVESECPAPLGAFYVYDWPSFSSSSAVHISTVSAKSGVSLRFKADSAAYPLGFVMHDVGIGAKSYSISHCPGTMNYPTLRQSGSISVNGDAYIDNCNTLPMLRYFGYNNPEMLQAQTTCWLKAGNIYYLNIWNESSDSSAEIQLQLGKLRK